MKGPASDLDSSALTRPGTDQHLRQTSLGAFGGKTTRVLFLTKLSRLLTSVCLHESTHYIERAHTSTLLLLAFQILHNCTAIHPRNEPVTLKLLNTMKHLLKKKGCGCMAKTTESQDATVTIWMQDRKSRLKPQSKNLVIGN